MGFCLRAFSNLGSRTQTEETSRTTKNWREKSSLKNYYTCEEIEKFNTLKGEKVNKNRPWDDAGDN